MKKNLLLDYEKFHKGSKIQSKIIKRKNFTYGKLIQLLEKYLNKEDMILDIGCGIGTIDFYLADKCKHLLGIDVSKGAIKVCRENSRVLGLEKKLEFKQSNFPVQNLLGQFNLIICSEVLEHLENDRQAVKTVFKLLSSGGVVIFSVPSQNAPLYRIGFLNKFEKKVGHLRRYLSEDLKEIINKEGFTIKEFVKTEGLLRNFLFVNPLGWIVIKVLNNVGSMSDIVTFFDNLSINFFGESNIFIVVQKP